MLPVWCQSKRVIKSYSSWTRFVYVELEPENCILSVRFDPLLALNLSRCIFAWICINIRNTQLTTGMPIWQLVWATIWCEVMLLISIQYENLFWWVVCLICDWNVIILKRKDKGYASKKIKSQKRIFLIETNVFSSGYCT